MAELNLKGFDSVFESTLSNELLDNIVEFFDWSLLEKGNYYNVTVGESSPNGYDYSEMKLSSHKGYTTGKAWEGFRENWVWQSGVAFNPAPKVGSDNTYPGISGVYVDSVFRPTSGVGTYAHYVDYFNGRVVFNSPIPTGSTVQVEHSYKWINVLYANSIPWLRDIQYRTYDKNSEFLETGKGNWDKSPESRVQLPAIAIEIIPRRNMKGYQLGGGQYVSTDVLFHCIAEDEHTRDKLVDIVSLQNEKTIYKFDSNRLASSGKMPIDFRGTPNSGAFRYPEMVNTYRKGSIRLKDSSVQGMDMVNSNLYGGIVKLTAEVIEPSI